MAQIKPNFYANDGNRANPNEHLLDHLLENEMHMHNSNQDHYQYLREIFSQVKDGLPDSEL